MSQATVLGDTAKRMAGAEKTMMDISDAMPEDKFGYKSARAERNYGEQIMHVALVNVSTLKAVGGKAVPPSLTSQRVKTGKRTFQGAGRLGSVRHSVTPMSRPTPRSSRPCKGRAFSGLAREPASFVFLLRHTMDIYGADGRVAVAETESCLRPARTSGDVDRGFNPPSRHHAGSLLRRSRPWKNGHRGRGSRTPSKFLMQDLLA